MKKIDFLSVIVLTKNEEAGIGHTLGRLRAFDEVVIVDSDSEDRTVDIAESAGARVVQFRWDGTYPKKKQWALENAGVRNDWVLLLDADEYPSDALIEELSGMQAVLSSTSYSAFDIHLSYRFAGRILRHGHVVTKRSLLHKDFARFPVIDDLNAPGIREVEGHYQPVADRRIGQLKARLVHDDRDPVSSWFARHNRYSDWEAHLSQNRKLRTEIASKRTAKGRVFDAVPFKPALFFVYAYVVRMGFRDGRAGFDYAVALSMYYWQIGVKSRELAAAQGERIRVIQLANTLDRGDGGPAHHALEVNIALNADGVATQLLVRRASGGHSTFDDAVAANRAPKYKPLGMLSIAGIRTAIASDVWIIHGYYLPWVPIVVLIGRFLRKGILLMPHGSLTSYQEQRSRSQKRVFNKLFGRLINRSVKFVVATPSEMAEAEGPSREIAVVGAGVEVPDRLGDRDESAWRLLTLSRIASKKRIDRAIDVHAELVRRGRPVRLTIAGDGGSDIVHALRERAKSLGVASSVQFAGPVYGAAKTDLLLNTHVLLAPSEDENFGFGPVEALAHGVPVVVTDQVASVASISLPAGYAASFDVQAAADAVEKLMQDHDVSSAAARSFVRERFSWNSVARKWTEQIDLVS
ncbi:glycosyltransferase [Microbacterium aquilitoris]|uniref:glycosyltransferase n=1 Tax=Microbacterium aquilitoris TaxID=3067307 RepID=UPI0028925E4E|nr:glycosyltransferase [Microbacterium sp. KSW2-22]MDT3346247.1 glycosyltransferase [Microbacterium sp. KSW2-22]